MTGAEAIEELIVSRVGKNPIPVPQDVEIKFSKGTVTAKGPKGELTTRIHPDLKFKLEDNQITIERPTDEKMHRSLHGLSRTLVANIIEGVVKGYEKRLEIIGVGYRAELRGEKLVISVGYSHVIVFIPPDEITLAVEGNNIIIVSGIQKQLVGQVAAKIRALRPPEPYKGKGIRYQGEQVRKKAGKTAA